MEGVIIWNRWSYVGRDWRKLWRNWAAPETRGNSISYFPKQIDME